MSQDHITLYQKMKLQVCSRSLRLIAPFSASAAILCAKSLVDTLLSADSCDGRNRIQVSNAHLTVIVCISK